MQEKVNMSTGESVKITFRFHNSLLSEIIGTFGCSVRACKTEKDWLVTTISAPDNEGLYRWGMQHGDRMEVLSPQHTREALLNIFAESFELYQ